MAKKYMQWEVTPLNYHFFGRVRYVENNELVEEKSELYSSESEAAEWVKEKLGIGKAETKTEDPEPQTPDPATGGDDGNN